jgi:hypothetical protein
MKNKYKELYELKLSEFQLTMCNLSIEELAMISKAMNDYYEQRLMCELLCGGVEDDSDI